jgi:hypothetical protein
VILLHVYISSVYFYFWVWVHIPAPFVRELFFGRGGYVCDLVTPCNKRRRRLHHFFLCLKLHSSHLLFIPFFIPSVWHMNANSATSFPFSYFSVFFFQVIIRCFESLIIISQSCSKYRDTGVRLITPLTTVTPCPISWTCLIKFFFHTSCPSFYCFPMFKFGPSHSKILKTNKNVFHFPSADVSLDDTWFSLHLNIFFFLEYRNEPCMSRQVRW